MLWSTQMYTFLCRADHTPLEQGFEIKGRSSDLSDPIGIHHSGEEVVASGFRSTDDTAG